MGRTCIVGDFDCGMILEYLHFWHIDAEFGGMNTLLIGLMQKKTAPVRILTRALPPVKE